MCSLNMAFFDFSMRLTSSSSFHLSFPLIVWKSSPFPPIGNKKVNVDAAFSKGTLALACIACDDFRLLVFAESKLVYSPSAFVAELMAID